MKLLKGISLFTIGGILIELSNHILPTLTLVVGVLAMAGGSILIFSNNKTNK